VRSLIRGLAAVVLLAVPLAGLGITLRALAWYEAAVTPCDGHAGAVFVEIPPGTRARSALAVLARAGVVCDPEVGLGLLERSGKARRVQAGEYRFDRPLAPVEVLRMLIEGRVFQRRLTIPEGLNRFEIAARFEALGFGSAESFLEASGDVAAIADLDPDAQDLEGYLFPDTYSLGRSVEASELVRRMVAQFRQVVGPDPVERARRSGRSLRDVVILASLVEKETARAEERPLVAGVYSARLRRGMLLQADPTVIYGLVREGIFDGNLKRRHLREPRPYNTYVHAGLPPGPIANPGRAALDAAFTPAETDYLYFVSRNDGSHAFSRTLAEHNRLVNEHQRRYWRERWRKEREAGVR